MVGEPQTAQPVARCRLCPAGCPARLVRPGDDLGVGEVRPASDQGMCPRGAALAELLNHPARIRWPVRRAGGRWREVPLASAIGEILKAAPPDGLTFLLDGNLPCEQMLQAAAWCSAWPEARLCLVVEPHDEQLLLGTEASGADYLDSEHLAGCDGFLVIGDVFAANPTCARAVFDRRKTEPRTAIVVIDPGGGTAVKFATHRVVAAPGCELEALAAVAAAAGVKEASTFASGSGRPDAGSAGQVLSKCQKLGVLLSAEYGRTSAWRQIGYLAGLLARGLHGGVAPQTAGGNVLAAVRLRAAVGAVSLAEALTPGSKSLVAVGCDVAGMLGWRDLSVVAAAAALPNITADAAGTVLPSAMADEVGGTCLLAGGRQVAVAPLMDPPGGVPSPAELIGLLAAAAGVSPPAVPGPVEQISRLAPDVPGQTVAQFERRGTTLLFARQGMHAGCGALTGHGSWQRAAQPEPELLVAPDDARALKLVNLSTVTVRVNGQSVRARVRTAPQVSPGTMVLPEGLPAARALMPTVIDSEGGTVAVPARTVQTGD